MEIVISCLWKIIEKITYFCVYKVFRLNVKTNKYEELIQFLKFGIVGLFNNAIFYIVYLFLLYLKVYYLMASIIGFTVSVFNSYYWNNKYVFGEDDNRVWWKTFLRTYISYAGTGILLSNALLILWVEVCGFSQIIAPFLNLIITVPLNFLINKFWAYRKEDEQS